MKKRRLGKSGIEIYPLVFGGNVFGWTVGKTESFQLLDAFIDAGFNCIDTADVYSTWGPGNKGGESEAIIGEWLKKTNKREKIIIATKVGKPMATDKKGLSSKYIRQAIEDSLHRLRTDYIDLYQSHDDDVNTPMQETLGVYTELIKAGKVRAIGASNFVPARFTTALQLSNQHGYARYESFQPPYNLYDRSFEKELEQICVDNEIGVISYYALASGFLTGKYRSEKDLSKSLRGKTVQKYLNERGFRILDMLEKISVQYNTTSGVIALAWLLAKPAITAPIASATSVEQLKDFTKAVELILDKESIELLDKVSY